MSKMENIRVIAATLVKSFIWLRTTEAAVLGRVTHVVSAKKFVKMLSCLSLVQIDAAVIVGEIILISMKEIWG